MPRVGNKHFAYTRKGEGEADRESKLTGLPVKHGYPNEMKGTKPGRSTKNTPGEVRTPSRTRRKPGY